MGSLYWGNEYKFGLAETATALNSIAKQLEIANMIAIGRLTEADRLLFPPTEKSE